MRWFESKKEDFVGLECVNTKTGKYLLRLSPNSNFTSEGEQQNDIRFISIFVNNYPSVKEIKSILLSLQEKYDNSAEVNSFYLNGKRVWLDKATRVGLVNSLNIEKATGKTDTILWFNNISININIDKALQLLAVVEMYAKECYNNTHQHMHDISKLETIEECLKFDITKNYPQKPNIEIE